MNKYIIFIIFTLSAFAVAPLMTIHTWLDLSSIIGFSIYFALIIILINKFKHKIKPTTILLFAFLGASVRDLSMHILYFNATISSLLTSIVHLIALPLGYYYTKLGTVKTKIIYSVICFTVAIIMSSWGHDLWVRLVFGQYQ